MTTKYAVYKRDIDAGHGTQTIVVRDGVCVDQYIKPKQAGARYTGDGNPEFVGQTPRQIGIKSNGFKRLTGTKLEDAILEYDYRQQFK